MNISKASFRLLATTVLFVDTLSLTACSTTEMNTLVQEPVEKTVQAEQKPSTQTLVQPTPEDYLFVQKALEKLGFQVGLIDGIWGKRSKQALDNFHLTKGLPINGGLISAADLFYLQELTGLTPDNITTPELPAQEDQEQNTQHGPKLIILNKQQKLLVRDNPFSEVITVLNAGTGIYILNRTDSWLEVESEKQLHGYIKTVPSRVY